MSDLTPTDRKKAVAGIRMCLVLLENLFRGLDDGHVVLGESVISHGEYEELSAILEKVADEYDSEIVDLLSNHEQELHKADEWEDLDKREIL